MKFLHSPPSAILFWVALFSSSMAQASPLFVTQGSASQRAGTKLVDVYYDLIGGVPPYSVTLQGSSDGGANWNLPCVTLSGNVGIGVAAGSNRVVTWNAGADWAGQVSSNVKFRVNVTDAATPAAPEGFALIPAGSFQMGDQSNPLVGYSVELPVHSVYVSAFYMGKYEVTKELWDEVRAWGLNNGYTDLPVGNGSYTSKGANHPVHSISWFDMVKWCNARSEKDGLTLVYTVSGAVMKTGTTAPTANWGANGYRLPTEAEWEKAARGGVAGKNFPWGTDTITHSQANYFSNTSNAYDNSPTSGFHPSYTAGGTPYTSPVGSFAPNGYGLYDIAGNIWERCWDWWNWNVSYPATSQTDPHGAASGTHRVIRGGSYANEAVNCRAADRYYDSSTITANYYGFRIARTSTP